MTEITYDVSGLNYAFNPPPHPSILSIIPDGGGSWVGYGNQSAAETAAMLADETANVYDSSYGADASEAGPSAFHNLRLGRMFAWNKVFQFSGDGPVRYGFRFLYNPSTISGRQNVGQDFIPNPTSRIGAMLPMGLEALNFEILLNRMPEVQGNAQTSDFLPPIDDAVMGEIRERGTHYDLDYLYRIANGFHDTTARSGTGDIGILLPNPVELIIGPFRSRGSVISLAATDKMFGPSMVPMLTSVQITFQRYLSFSPDEEQLERLRSSGVYYDGEEDPYSPGVKDKDGSPATGTDGSAPSSGSNEGQPVLGNSARAPAGDRHPDKNYVTAGWRYPSSGKLHAGWDYNRFKIGDDVFATRGGTVTHAGPVPGGGSYGEHVIVRTGNVYHYYAHLSRLLVKKGDVIPPGHKVGKSGNTGRSTGPHLHYEERLEMDFATRRPEWAERTKNDAAEGSAGGP